MAASADAMEAQDKIQTAMGEMVGQIKSPEIGVLLNKWRKLFN